MQSGVRRHPGTGSKSPSVTALRNQDVTQDAEPLLLMEQKQLFKAVDEGRADQIFFADTTDGQAPFKVVGKDEQDHGEGVRQVRHDKLRQECVGLSAAHRIWKS